MLTIEIIAIAVVSSIAASLLILLMCKQAVDREIRRQRKEQGKNRRSINNRDRMNILNEEEDPRDIRLMNEPRRRPAGRPATPKRPGVLYEKTFIKKEAKPTKPKDDGDSSKE